MEHGIYTSYTCDNGMLVAKVAALYFKDGWKICDVTYGKGVFWRRIDTNKYDLHVSDLLTVPARRYDCRKLPYQGDMFDAHVFDPPYVHNPGNLLVNSNYKNRETTKGLYHRDIIRLYREGMMEGKRVLKNGGLMLVKCKDELESAKQRMSHVELHDIAVKDLGMQVEDLFIMTQKTPPVIQHRRQNHARKNHSYLWVFRKA